MLNWAILGTGFISNTMADAITASSGSSIHTIAGRNQDALTDFKTRYSIPNTSHGYQEVLQHADIDVIYIGLPNHVHHEISIAAAHAGKAVLCEKSMSTTMGNATAMAQAAVKNQTFFAEGLMYLAHPMYHRLHEILQDGRLGELRSITGHYAADIWQFANPLGQGTLFNLGCYPVSLMQFVIQTLCGDATFSNYDLDGFGNASPKDGTLLDAAVVARFENGVLATLQSSDGYGIDFGFSICGENGTLRFATNPWLPEAGENRLQWCPYDGAAEDIIITDPQNGFYHQVKMVETALKTNKQEAPRPSPSLSDSLEIMAFLTDWHTACTNGFSN